MIAPFADRGVFGDGVVVAAEGEGDFLHFDPATWVEFSGNDWVRTRWYWKEGPGRVISEDLPSLKFNVGSEIKRCLGTEVVEETRGCT